MNWIQLTELSQLEEITNDSMEAPVIIFKHSTRCSISGTALSRFERAWTGTESCYYLDLIQYRPISAAIVEKFHVEHQSPQILVIQKGNCTYHSSHWDIQADQVKNHLEGV